MSYCFRLNVIPVGCEGEGDFWWFETTEELQSASGSYKSYGLGPQGWSTTALEEVPCALLPKLTGKQWKVSHHRMCPDAIYESEDGDIAYWECVEGRVEWMKEKEALRSQPKFHMFSSTGTEMHTDNIGSIVLAITQSINMRAKGYR